MKELQCFVGVNFGMEAVAKRELEDLGFEEVHAKDGRVYFLADEEGILRANLWMRTAERIYLVLGEFVARSFEELFQGVTKLPWEEHLPKDGCFLVSGKSVKSTLYSVSDCQRIAEKAIVKRLQKTYPVLRFPKSGERYKIEVSLLKDVVTVALDTSGEGLHKRGYRLRSGRAPLTETLAAGLVNLSFWRPDRLLADPCCGSGTILIEAAMAARKMAPGLGRSFDCESWMRFDRALGKRLRQEAYEVVDMKKPLELVGSDIDRKVLSVAKQNALEAGVADDIRFFCKDVATVDYPDDYGVIITNPPYGERIGKGSELERVYKDLGRLHKSLHTYSTYMVTSLKEAPKLFGKKPDRLRRLYNGRIEVTYYQFYGPRPPREAGKRQK